MTVQKKLNGQLCFIIHGSHMQYNQVHTHTQVVMHSHMGACLLTHHTQSQLWIPLASSKFTKQQQLSKAIKNT